MTDVVLLGFGRRRELDMLRWERPAWITNVSVGNQPYLCIVPIP